MTKKHGKAQMTGLKASNRLQNLNSTESLGGDNLNEKLLEDLFAKEHDWPLCWL